jgi:hypothetical protein
MQAADRDDVIERPGRKRRIEDAAEHDVTRQLRLYEPMTQHPNRTVGNVEPSQPGPGFRDLLRQRAVTEPDLQNLPAGEFAERDVVVEPRIVIEELLVELAEGRARIVLDSELRGEIGTAALVPKDAVLRVDSGHRLLSPGLEGRRETRHRFFDGRAQRREIKVVAGLARVQEVRQQQPL